MNNFDFKPQKLALLGGDPIREKSYDIHTTNIDDVEEKEILAVLRSGHLSGFSGRAGERFLGGEKVKALEARFCEYFNMKHAVSFNSATSGLHGAIAALNIGPGDEVITSPFTMSASATSILMSNAIPVFADVELDTYCLDPISIEARVTKNTKAILVVNLFGQASQLDEIKKIADKHHLYLIEDNAQSFGVHYQGKLTGTFGNMGVFSFNYHKVIQSGEGGVVITDDDRLAFRLQMIRNHAEAVADDLGMNDDLNNMLGWNYRLTEIQAAMGICQIDKLNYLSNVRKDLAVKLTEVIDKYDFLLAPCIRKESEHGFYLYPIKYCEDRLNISRNTFVKALAHEGISVSSGYMKPIYLIPLFQKKIAYGDKGCPFTCGFYNGEVNYKKGLCPVSERLYEKELLITNICRYPNTDNEILEFDRALQKIVIHQKELKVFESQS